VTTDSSKVASPIKIKIWQAGRNIIPMRRRLVLCVTD